MILMMMMQQTWGILDSVNDHGSSLSKSKLSQIVFAKPNKPKVSNLIGPKLLCLRVYMGINFILNEQQLAYERKPSKSNTVDLFITPVWYSGYSKTTFFFSIYNILNIIIIVCQSMFGHHKKQSFFKKKRRVNQLINFFILLEILKSTPTPLPTPSLKSETSLAPRYLVPRVVPLKHSHQSLQTFS